MPYYPIRDDFDAHDPERKREFPTTSWTLIRKVQQGSEAEARRAMEAICRSYWYPIYAFARRTGFNTHDAEARDAALL